MFSNVHLMRNVPKPCLAFSCLGLSADTWVPTWRHFEATSIACKRACGHVPRATLMLSCRWIQWSISGTQIDEDTGYPRVLQEAGGFVKPLAAGMPCFCCIFSPVYRKRLLRWKNEKWVSPACLPAPGKKELRKSWIFNIYRSCSRYQNWSLLYWNVLDIW